MAHAHAVLQQRLLEREGTADGERDKVVSPILTDVIRLVDHFAVTEDAITWYVGADVQVPAKFRQMGIPHLADR